MQRCFFIGPLGERGVAALEFAFVLPVLMLIAFGVIDFARAVWTQTTVDYAVQAAARCAAINPINCTAPGGGGTNVPAYAANQAYGIPAKPGDFTYTASATCATDANGVPVKGASVRGSFPFTFYFPLFTHYSGPLTANACYPT